MEFIKVEAELPPPFYLVIVRRKTGNHYLAWRNNNVLSIDTDASRSCHWYGAPIDDLDVKNGKFHSSNFSDVTVDSWAYISINN